MNALEQLANYSDVVIDSGNLEEIKKFKPLDCTTNPSLILNAARDESCQALIEQAVRAAKNENNNDIEWVDACIDHLVVEFGSSISKMIPGLVSSEVDAALSFDTTATVERALRIIKLYSDRGIAKERILIKIAATWEGILAAQILEKKGIRCNMTLIFNITQAIACAEAGATLISPFVGRILDWHKNHVGRDFTAEEDPGVLSVKNIYHCFKARNYSTIIMAASFRNVGEVLELAGCDKLTISPALMNELRAKDNVVTSKINTANFDVHQLPQNVTEGNFRWLVNEDVMASEKLADGIRRFHTDTEQLRNILRKQ